MNPYEMPLVPRLPAASLVITRPPQSPGAGMQTVTSTEGHETAFASEASTGDAGAFGLSFRLGKIALLLVVDPPGVLVPVAVTAPPLMVIGPPSDLTTSPEPTSRFPPWSVRAPSNKYPRGCVDVASLGVIHARSRLAVPSNTMASRPLPPPTLPRMFPAKSANRAGR